MPSVSPKRKQSFTDSSELGPGSLAKRPRIELSNEVGDSWAAGNDDTVELKAKLEEITKRYSELEKKARISSEAIQRVQERLQCSICKDTMRNPHTLECGHSACLKCLRRCFISARELSGYQVYGDGMVSTDDDSDVEEEVGEMIGQLSVSLPRRHRFRSVVHHKKECPICKTGIWRRPIIDYTLRHVIDELHLTPLSSTALMDRDLRWGRRRDVWRGIFPADLYADNHRQEAQSRTRAQAQTRNQNQNQNQTPIPGRSESPPLPLLPPPSFFEIRYANPRQAAADPDANDNADVRRRRRQRRSNPVIGGSTSLSTTGPTPVRPLAPSPPQASSSRTETSNPSVEPELEPEFELGLGSRLTRHETTLLPQLDFLEGIDIFSIAEEAEIEIEIEIEAEVETLRASPAPPQLEHSHLPDSAASSLESNSLHPQPTIQNILQILRPQFVSQSNSVDLSPNAAEDEAEVKENEQMCGCDVRERESEDEDEDDDVDFSLIHAMLHGENADTASGSGSGSDSLEVEGYPVYVEDLELPVQEDGDDGVWLGADLED